MHSKDLINNMKISVGEKNNILLEEVFNSINLKTPDGEEMWICMRDSGFEFKYNGKLYFAKDGTINLVKIDGNL